MSWLKLILSIIASWFTGKYDPDSLREQAKKKDDDELDKKKSRLKVLNIEIADTMGELNDAINLKNSDSVCRLSVVLVGLRKERDKLQADIPTWLPAGFRG